MTQLDIIRLKAENAILKEENEVLSAENKEIRRLFYELREQNIRLIVNNRKLKKEKS